MSTDKTHAYPFRRIYLDPHCGRKPIPYNIDRRSLRKEER